MEDAAVLSGFEIEMSALPRSARPVVPPKVRAIPASGFTTALGMYETNGLTATEDWAMATGIGANVMVDAAKSIRRVVDTTPPRLIAAGVRVHAGCQ